MKAKVSNFTSPSGNSIANQFIISVDNRTYFQSYDSIIACKLPDSSIVLDQYYWDYSTTTGKYRNQFLGESKKETQSRIDSGEYTLANLN